MVWYFLLNDDYDVYEWWWSVFFEDCAFTSAILTPMELQNSVSDNAQTSSRRGDYLIMIFRSRIFTKVTEDYSHRALIALKGSK